MTVLIATFILPFIIGYWYGKNDVDPNTVEGKIYYSTGENNE